MAVDGYLNFDTKINTKGFNAGTKQITNGLSGMKSMLGKLGGAVAVAFSVRTLVNFGKEAVNLASDIQEVQNVVDTSFGSLKGQMEDFADKSIQTYGISKLVAKQTGSTYMAMAKGMQIADENAAEMALTLTGLSADMASFYNKEQSVTATALNSVFTGETETLKQFGIVMTEANLQQFAYTQGINKKVSALSQAEKVQLRYNYVMQQTSLAQGDFARTQNSWANQTRILSEMWKEFSGTVGTILMNTLLPAVQSLNKAMTWLNAVAQSALETLSAVFGWDIEANNATAVSDAIGAAVDNQNALTDAVNETAEAQERQLMGFDKINKLNDDSSSGSSGASAVAGGSYEVPVDIDTEKAEKKLTDFQEKLKAFISSLKITFNDVFFDWKDLTGEQIAEKLITSLTTIAGTVIGFGLGGIKGAAIGATVGASLGVFINAITFDHDGKFSADEITNMVVLALGSLLGAGVGLYVGGPGGAAIGLTVGLGISLLSNSLIDWEQFGKDIKYNWDKLWKTTSEMFSDAKKDIDRLLKSIGEGFVNMFSQMKTWFKNKKSDLKKSWNNFTSVVKDKTAKMKAKVATKLADFKKSWNSRAKLVKDKTAKMKLSFAEKVADIKTAAKERLNAITEVFSKIPSWFKDTFSNAWQNVKNVFSSGGKVFEGIKEGILNGLKSVINALIDGINWVISIPFNGINTALEKIKNVSIAGKKPFYEKISTINVPQIPKLATGTVVPANYGEFLAILGDNKREAEVVSPLSTIKKAVAEVMGSGGEQTINLTVELDGEVVYRKVVKKNKQNTKMTGVNELATA